MRKFGFARSIRKEQIGRESIVLNPSSDVVLTRNDKPGMENHGLVAIDCSWNRSDPVFAMRFKGMQRKLPSLLAGNPTNYSKLGSLSSIEAVAASLFIVDQKDLARRILSLYKWGETFLTLNNDPLEDYSKAQTIDEMIELEKAYFPQLFRAP